MSEHTLAPADREQLRSGWLKLLASIGADRAAADRAFADLAKACAGSGRFYHTLGHVAHVLATASEVVHQARNPAALFLAVWFHDVVYDASAGDNEARSADRAAEVLGRLGVAVTVIEEVRRLILLTQSHQCAGDDPDGHILLDADLAILGAPPDEYDRYAQAIRQEYAWVPEEEYRAGRKAVLQKLEKRERIFHTEQLHQRLEAAARDNLQRERASLE